MQPIIFTANATDFQATITKRDDALVLTLRGSAEHDARDQLPALLVKLDDTVLDEHSTLVEVDFRQVDFMNSSCFKEFVAWLSRLKARQSADQYRVVLRSSSRARWQRASLNALSCFAASIVEVKAE